MTLQVQAHSNVAEVRKRITRSRVLTTLYKWGEVVIQAKKTSQVALLRREGDELIIGVTENYDPLAEIAMVLAQRHGRIDPSNQEHIVRLQGELEMHGVQMGPRFQFTFFSQDYEYAFPSDVDDLFRDIDDAQERHATEVTKIWNKLYGKYGAKAMRQASSRRAIDFSKGHVTEQEIKLMLARMRKGEKDPVPWKDYPDGVPLSKEQNRKGHAYLMNLWRSPSGKERSDNPFGHREQEVLENFSEFRLVDWFDASHFGQKPFYHPYYRVLANDGGSFEYAFYNGEVHILG